MSSNNSNSSNRSLTETEQALRLVATWVLDGNDLLSAQQARNRARVVIAKRIDATVRLSMDRGNFHMAILDWIALRDEKTVAQVATEMGYGVRRANAIEIEDYFEAESQRKRTASLGHRYSRMSKTKRNPPLVVEWAG